MGKEDLINNGNEGRNIPIGNAPNGLNDDKGDPTKADGRGGSFPTINDDKHHGAKNDDDK